MRRIISYNETISDESLIQLIGESEIHEPESHFTDEENTSFLKNARLCSLLNDLEFTIESYGLLNFLIEYNDQISELEELGTLLKEFGDVESEVAIRKTLAFYKAHIDSIKYLESDPNDFDSKYSFLEEELNSISDDEIFSIPLHHSIKLIAKHIRENKSKFFTSTNLI